MILITNFGLTNEDVALGMLGMMIIPLARTLLGVVPDKIILCAV